MGNNTEPILKDEYLISEKNPTLITRIPKNRPIKDTQNLCFDSFLLVFCSSFTDSDGRGSHFYLISSSSRVCLSQASFFKFLLPIPKHAEHTTLPLKGVFLSIFPLAIPTHSTQLHLPVPSQCLQSKISS